MPVDQVVCDSVWMQTTKVFRNRDIPKKLLDFTAYLDMQDLALRRHIKGYN